MRTDLENVLLLLLGSDFTESDGDTKAPPTGYFGYFVLDEQFIEDVKNAFGASAVSAEELEALEGLLRQREAESCGVLMSQDDYGFISSEVGEVEDVKSAFSQMQTEYSEWLGEPEF